MIRDLVKIFGTKTKALEILYLMEDIKPVVRHGFYDGELSQIEEFCKLNKLHFEKSSFKVVILDAGEGEYSNKGIKVNIDDPRRGMFFVYISKDEKLAATANAYEFKNNNKDLGLSLGYPECCINFFVQNEPMQSKLTNDYVHLVLQNSKGKKFQFYTNICKRDFDITLINHFPCSFGCRKSIDLAKQHLDALKKYDSELAKEFIQKLRCKVKIEKEEIEFC
ncbi:DUF483 domain-containing protein [Candidatus Woesearchaeota archaeon]|nr:DUF483 domain-containing protein [Candidatus Woesearchaeota archaeon]